MADNASRPRVENRGAAHFALKFGTAEQENDPHAHAVLARLPYHPEALSFLGLPRHIIGVWYGANVTNAPIDSQLIRKLILHKPVATAQPTVPQRRASAANASPGVLTTQVGLQIPPGMNFEDWEQTGRRLAGIIDSSAWWLGDWLVYGKDNYADRYQRGIRAVGLKYQTLRNYAWVSRRFEQARRHARLTFQHHAEVASLPLEEQDSWLSRAEDCGWTTKQLRTAIQDVREPAAPCSAQQPAISQLPVPESNLRQWLQAAQFMGVDFEDWVLMTLDSAAKQDLAEEPEPDLPESLGLEPDIGPLRP